MNFLKNFFLILIIWLTGCVTPPIQPAPFVPYKSYDYPPPSPSGSNSEPTSLRCIDNSNIYVHCNEAWWWAGPERGWIPTGGGWYPWPRQIWSDKIFNLYPNVYRDSAPVLVFPY